MVITPLPSSLIGQPETEAWRTGGLHSGANSARCLEKLVLSRQ